MNFCQKRSGESVATIHSPVEFFLPDPSVRKSLNLFHQVLLQRWID